LWITINPLGVIIVSRRELLSLTARTEALLPIEESVRAYVMTGDRKYLGDMEPKAIPYPNANRLAELLDDPMLRNILPTSIRAPLAITKANSDDGTFVRNGWAPAVTNPSYERGWGSFSGKAAAAQGIMQSNALRVSTRYLRFQTTGNTGKGTSLELQDARTNEPVAVVPETRENEYWWRADVKVSGRDVRIIARDNSTTGWLAFREPRELPRLSYYAECIAKRVGSFVCLA
jgi:hypothetical protein